MGLLDWANKRLSEVMQQKVQSLAAVLHRPDLIVLYALMLFSVGVFEVAMLMHDKSATLWEI